MAPTAEKAQLAPHLPSSLTPISAPLDLQSILLAGTVMFYSPSGGREEEDTKGDLLNPSRLWYSSGVQSAKWFTSRVKVFSGLRFISLIF
jgi:hypothetical protein